MELTASIIAELGGLSLGLAAGVIDRPLYVAMLTMVASSIAVSSVAVRFVGTPPSATASNLKG